MKITIKQLERVSETTLKKARLLGFDLLASTQYEEINGIIYEVK